MDLPDDILHEVARRMRGDMLRHRMSFPDEERRRYWQVPDANHSLMLARSALDAIPDGWAKQANGWTEYEWIEPIP